MAKTRVVLNSAGVRELLKSAGVRGAVTAVAEKVRAQAEATAPYDSSADRPQHHPNGTPNIHFRDSFRVEQATTDRAVARVVSHDPKGAVKEATHRTMTRALDAGRS